MIIRNIAITCALSVAALAACTDSGGPSAEQTNVAADEAERSLADTNKRWLELIRQKDAAGTAQLYTEDGRIMPPGAAASVGREAVQAQWQMMMQAPGFDLTFKTDRLVVSQAADMAIDIGTYRYVAGGPDGPQVDNGKYVVAWRKVGDEWKVFADIFNSDPAAAE